MKEELRRSGEAKDKGESTDAHSPPSANRKSKHSINNDHGDE